LPTQSVSRVGVWDRLHLGFRPVALELRRVRHLYAFDLIELNGDDLRRDPLDVCKATLRSVLAKAAPGLRFNEHIEADGPTVFAHACKMGLEGIVSKRKASTYRSGRSADSQNRSAFMVNAPGRERPGRRVRSSANRCMN